MRTPAPSHTSSRSTVPARKARLARFGVIVTAVLALTAAVLQSSTASAASSSTASAAGPAHHPSPKSTIVLVHGAWADGSSWNGEVKRLQDKGYTVEVAPNPLRGVSSDSDSLAAYLSTIAGPIVLVGHSYGGFVTTNAATGNPNIKALVYVDAFVPDQGESIGSLTTGSGSILEPALTDPASVFTLRPFPGAPAGVADSYVLPNLFVTGFAADLPAREANALAAEQLPLATNAFGETSGVPAWKTIPSWSLIGTADKVIPATGQEAMSHRAGAHIVTVTGGSHLTLISHPRQVTDLIITAEQATS